MAMETFPAMIVAVQSGAVDGYVAEAVSYTHLDVYKRQARHRTGDLPRSQGARMSGTDRPQTDKTVS